MIIHNVEYIYLRINKFSYLVTIKDNVSEIEFEKAILH